LSLLLDIFELAKAKPSPLTPLPKGEGNQSHIYYILPLSVQERGKRTIGLPAAGRCAGGEVKKNRDNLTALDCAEKAVPDRR